MWTVWDALPTRGAKFRSAVRSSLGGAPGYGAHERGHSCGPCPKHAVGTDAKQEQDGQHVNRDGQPAQAIK